MLRVSLVLELPRQRLKRPLLLHLYLHARHHVLWTRCVAKSWSIKRGMYRVHFISERTRMTEPKRNKTGRRNAPQFVIAPPPNRGARANQTSSSTQTTHLISSHTRLVRASKQKEQSRRLIGAPSHVNLWPFRSRARDARMWFAMVGHRPSASSQLHHHQIRSPVKFRNPFRKCSNFPHHTRRRSLPSALSLHPTILRNHSQNHHHHEVNHHVIQH